MNQPIKCPHCGLQHTPKPHTPPSCSQCANRGRLIPYAQESYCENCVHEGSHWKNDHYKEKK